MSEKTYTIRTMTQAEVADIAVAFAVAEGWNPGWHDADSFYAADPNGFLVGLLGEEPVSCISVIRYGTSFGFLGLYIVKADYRGQGYGLKIWNAGMKYLQGRNVGLDGVPDQQANYKKSGFHPAYRNIRYEGSASKTATSHPAIVPLASLAFDDLLVYDRTFFPEDRTNFIRSWVHQPESISLGITHNGRIAGYGVIRPCRKGYKIGPLFADNTELAEALLTALQNRIPIRASFYLDVPEPNPAALAIAEKHNMSVVFETARMYTQEFPAIPINSIFGVTTFELG